MILGANLSHQTLLSSSPSPPPSSSSSPSFNGQGGGEGEVVSFLLLGFHVVYLYKKKVKVVSRLREEVVFECSLTVCYVVLYVFFLFFVIYIH